MDYELAIVGAGPAGYSAAIYAVRSGIKTVIFDKSMGGGLAAIAPNIENYAGFEAITGMDLMEKMKTHVEKYTEINFNEEVKNISKKNDEFLIKTNNKEYKVKAVLISTGTEHRRLDAPGEKKLSGKGVSYCATCDGFFFKEKKVAIVGGGNSALIEAIYLKQIGCSEVYVIHRRDQFRAEESYVNEAEEKGVKFVLDSIVEKINGEEKVESLDLKDKDTGEIKNIDIDGVFISIGEIPQNDIAKKLDVNLDEKGYIKIDKQGRTNVKGVYAAGDITGGLRQIITAAAEGAIASLTTTEVLGKKYPY